MYDACSYIFGLLIYGITYSDYIVTKMEGIYANENI